MNGRKAKLLRRVAKLTGKSDRYIKNSFAAMTPEQQQAYLQFLVMQFAGKKEESAE